MKSKAKWVFTVLGLITAAALIVPALIPCNAKGSNCTKEKIKEQQKLGCTDKFDLECK